VAQREKALLEKGRCQKRLEVNSAWLKHLEKAASRVETEINSESPKYTSPVAANDKNTAPKLSTTQPILKTAAVALQKEPPRSAPSSVKAKPPTFARATAQAPGTILARNTVNNSDHTLEYAMALFLPSQVDSGAGKAPTKSSERKIANTQSVSTPPRTPIEAVLKNQNLADHGELPRKRTEEKNPARNPQAFEQKMENHSMSKIPHQKQYAYQYPMDSTLIDLGPQPKMYRRIHSSVKDTWISFLDAVLHQLSNLNDAAHQHTPMLVHKFLAIPSTFLKTSGGRDRHKLRDSLVKAQDEARKAIQDSAEETNNKGKDAIEEDDTLLLQHQEQTTKKTSHASKKVSMPTENTIRKAKAIAITNMVKAGNCSKAYEKLKQAPLAPVNCRTILALEKLHPPLSKPIPRKYTDFYARDNRSYTYFSEEEILTAIKRSTKGAAPG